MSDTYDVKFLCHLILSKLTDKCPSAVLAAMRSSFQEQSQPGHLRRSSRSSALTSYPNPVEVFDNEVVPASLQSSIAPILRAAVEIQSSHPRVAYLCRAYALDKTERTDPNSNGRGVMQFKTSLLQRLKRIEKWDLSIASIWNTVVWLVLINFSFQIVTATAQSFLKKKQEKELGILNDRIHASNQTTSDTDKPLCN